MSEDSMNQNPQFQSIEEIEVYLKKQELILQSFQKKIDGLYNELGVSPEQLQEFLEDKSRFSYDAWEKMEEERKRLITLRDVIEKKNSPSSIFEHAKTKGKS